MFTPSWLFLSLVIGLVGLALFTYGKKQGRMPQLIAGLALMVYPYFVYSFVGMLIVGLGIVAACWGALRLGW
ncbi:MAG TPA: hypothetical protein VNE16_13840 [Vicinamibacterales bacterium]|nr:hypothetical protein [Vicinamibacterales bacterium]